jgi:hypothetical protein
MGGEECPVLRQAISWVMRQEKLLGGSRYFLSDKWEDILYTAHHTSPATEA